MFFARMRWSPDHWISVTLLLIEEIYFTDEECIGSDLFWLFWLSFDSSVWKSLLTIKIFHKINSNEQKIIHWLAQTINIRRQNWYNRNDTLGLYQCVWVWEWMPLRLVSNCFWCMKWKILAVKSYQGQFNNHQFHFTVTWDTEYVALIYTCLE